MNNISKRIGALLLCLAAGLAFGQSVSRIGTIQDGVIKEGYLIIDGRRLDFHPQKVVITYKGVDVPAKALQRGMRISYRLNEEGRIAEIVLIAPVNMLDALLRH